MTSWDIVTIGHLIDDGEASLQTGPFGTQLKASEYVKSGVPVINVKNIGYGDLRTDDLDFVTEKVADRLRVHRLSTGDIVFGRKGAADRHALIGPASDGWLQGSDCMRLRLKTKRVTSRFLSYYFCTSGHKYWMEAVCAFGATMSTLNQGIARRISLHVPRAEIREKIAGILSAYDGLIDNNKRRIALLEELAEEIYREWFVRLRFPGHRSTPFKKGLPADWNTKRVKEIVVRKRFGRIYRQTELFDEGQVAVIDQSRADYLGFYDGEPQHRASHDNPTILFGDHTCKMVFMVKPFSLAENVIPFRSQAKISPYFLYHLVKDLARTTEYKRHWTELINREVLIPGENLQLGFENAIKQGHEQIELLREAIRKAEKIRNVLLPRLISGRLSVDNLDIQSRPDMADELNAEPRAAVHA
jgi:type I restriction enzyme S subunit